MSAIDRKADSEEKSAACLLAIILISQIPARRCRLNLKCSRISRLIRLRLTAGPTFLVTVMPIRDRPSRLGEKMAMKCSFCIRRPDLARARYSRLFKILSALVKKNRNGQASHLDNRDFSFRADKYPYARKDKHQAALQNIVCPAILRYLPLPINVNKLPGQSRPSLGSPSIYNSSALFGGHAFQKAVISGPFDSAGLKCSFHFKISLFAMPGRR